MLCTAIENEDPDKLIKLTVDYPENSDDFVPFLNVEVKIERDGQHTSLSKPPKKCRHSMPIPIILIPSKNILLLICNLQQKMSHPMMRISFTR